MKKVLLCLVIGLTLSSCVHQSKHCKKTHKKVDSIRKIQYQ